MKLPKQLEKLRNEKVWMNYVLYKKDGKLKKPPIDPWTLGAGSSTDSNKLSTFDKANANIGKTGELYVKDLKRTLRSEIKGVGISLEAAGLTGVDLDHVLERSAPGELKPVYTEVKQIWQYLNSYTEVSVSGTGIHILMWGKNPNEEMNKNGLPKGMKIANPDGTEYEMYDNGRYFVVTGKVLKGCPEIENRQEQINVLYEKVFRARKFTPSVGSCLPSCSSGSGERAKVAESDVELWKKAFNSGRGMEIRRLYDGDYSNFMNEKGTKHDRSRADLAIINHLFYWTNGDEPRIERMYMQTALDHSKWENLAYRQDTMNTARANWTPYRGYTAAERKVYAQMMQAKEIAEFDKKHPGMEEYLRSRKGANNEDIYTKQKIFNRNAQKYMDDKLRESCRGFL